MSASARPNPAASCRSSPTITRPAKSISSMPTGRPSELRLVAPRRHGHEYHVEHHGDRLYITTNSGDAEDFRICTASWRRPEEANWAELFPHKPGRFIIETVLFASHLARLEREESLPHIVVRRLSDGAEHQIAFDEEAYGLGLSAGYEFETKTVRFSYSSMTTPTQVYDYDMETRERTFRKAQEIPSGHDPANYVTRRIFAPAKDGALIPVSILYRKGTKLDGSAPLFLYGYGSYGIPIPASFLIQPPIARRPRLRLRHRAYPRRQGQRLPLVRRRQAGQEA